jgi:hypothetical protein
MSAQIQQGIISHYFDPLCFPEWELIENLLSYGLYRRSIQEHTSPIERMRVWDVNGASSVRGLLLSFGPCPSLGCQKPALRLYMG